MKHLQWLAPDKYVAMVKISYVIVATARSCRFRAMLPATFRSEFFLVTCVRARARADLRRKD
jgi:hypothetical protein